MLFTSIGVCGEGRDEAAVKVAFLYNFFKFIDWPAGAATEVMTLCTSHDPSLTEALTVLAGKTVNGRPLRVMQDIDPARIGHCHLLFLHRDGVTDIGHLLVIARTSHAVTVGDYPSFIESGGIIGLIKNGNRLVFEINLEQAARQGHHIDAQMLKLARRVLAKSSEPGQ
ncbi:MAG: YfiR family protein [Methylomonas sp.]|nr:YfiR family protein [Methylomonas sp.]PPD22963.1 MAG: hypothetical protein CTY23_00800 [Methylomonas sp.]PPD27408.1 MAG: hypothetical protein CTY22_02125 [Methylomonas sp.]PPD39384.1 MAG: hypothetical protein CTY21_02120 [Methylomonas sp.]PPD41999.1 MAG: hypothetical protein CTY17_02695 [Methylomonas sp.]